jgi:hypothetical protein
MPVASGDLLCRPFSPGPRTGRPGFLLIICFASSVELNPSSGSLPSTAPMSPSAISAQNLVMSSSGVGADASVTLTLADTQGVLSGGLDTVTLNITSQVGLFSIRYTVLYSY